MALGKLFISHSHEDEVLVSAICTLLEVGAGVPSELIFCTSMPSSGLAPGSDVRAEIRSELANSAAALTVITPFFYRSLFCMCELGALWGSRKKFTPLVVPPITKNDLKAVIEGLHALTISDSDDLDSLRDFLLEALGVKGTLVARWNHEKKKFLLQFPSLYRSNSAAREKGLAFLNNTMEGVALGLSRWLTKNDLATVGWPWLFVLDVDRQKQINANYGLVVGDKVLSEIGSVIEKSMASCLSAGRCGDDTFYVLLQANSGEAMEFADHLLSLVKGVPERIGEETLWTTASIGLAKYISGQSTAIWTARAHQGCIQAQREGGNRAVVGPDIVRIPERRWS